MPIPLRVDQIKPLILIEHKQPQFFRLLELGARPRSGDQDVGVGGNRSGDLRAEPGHGFVERPLSLSLVEMQARFEVAEVTAVLECAGNGRVGLMPLPTGEIPVPVDVASNGAPHLDESAPAGAAPPPAP